MGSEVRLSQKEQAEMRLVLLQVLIPAAFLPLLHVFEFVFQIKTNGFGTLFVVVFAESFEDGEGEVSGVFLLILAENSLEGLLSSH